MFNNIFTNKKNKNIEVKFIYLIIIKNKMLNKKPMVLEFPRKNSTHGTLVGKSPNANYLLPDHPNLTEKIYR